MKFVDEVRIKVKAGDGGRGCASFRREKFVPRGGPSGGDGGAGGDIVVEADAQLATLLDLSYQKQYRAARGEHGRGKQQYGKRGEDRIIRVPVGTVIRDAKGGIVLADLTNAGQRVIVAAGGQGGLGNAHFASSTNRAPRRTTPPSLGEEKELELEIKLLADVGIIGLPNAGKSTLIAALTAARPHIADYPFTTLVPNLGVVATDEETRYVVADIPGLIEGAHRGEGLGHKFLRHISRTILLIHVVDAGRVTPEDPLADWTVVNRELELFDPSLLEKPQILVANKIDLPAAGEKVALLKAVVTQRNIPFCALSALSGEGLAELRNWIAQMLERGKPKSAAEHVATGA
ncbi:MAG: GTPase ObgE [Candidatus Binatia bacterium]